MEMEYLIIHKLKSNEFMGVECQGYLFSEWIPCALYKGGGNGYVII